MMDEEKRHFKRYESRSECEVSLGKNTYKGRIVDYSDGIGAVFKSAPHLAPGKKVNIKVFEPEMEFKGEVVWVDKSGDELRAGFSRLDSFQGSLKNFALADILIGLQRSTKTGVLEVEIDSIVKEIFIKNGDMIYAFSNDKKDGLGDFLLRNKEISLEEYNQADSLFKKSGERLGKIFVELGFLTPKKVFLAVRHQVEDIIMSLFAVEDGIFKFLEGPLPHGELVTLRISAANIIYRGIKRVSNVQHIKQAAPAPDAVLEISQKPLNIFQNVVLDETDKEILSRINGMRTLKTIMSLSPSNDSDTLKSICALLSLRLIAVKREDVAPAGARIEEIISEPAEEVTSEFIEKVEDIVRICEALGYYEMLGIERDVSAEEISKAYYRASKEFHPDRHFSISSDDLKVKLTKIFSSIENAYKVLSDPEKRAEYDRTLSPGAMELPREISDEFIISEEGSAFETVEKNDRDSSSEEIRHATADVEVKGDEPVRVEDKIIEEQETEDKAASIEAKDLAERITEREPVFEEAAAVEKSPGEEESIFITDEVTVSKPEGDVNEPVDEGKTAERDEAEEILTGKIHDLRVEEPEEEEPQVDTVKQAREDREDIVIPEKESGKKSRLYIPVGIIIAVVIAAVLVFTFKNSEKNEITTTPAVKVAPSQDDKKQLRAQNTLGVSNKLPEQEKPLNLNQFPDNKVKAEKKVPVDKKVSETDSAASVENASGVSSGIAEKPEKEIKPETIKETESVEGIKKRKVLDKSLFAKYGTTEQKVETQKIEKAVSESPKEKPVSKEKTIFKPRNENFMRYKEQFNDNAGKWDIYDMTMASARIEDGNYYIANKSETSELIILHYADFPLSKDSIIETAIKTIKASDNHSYGFVFGAKDGDNNYVFQITGDGSYSIKTHQNGISRELSGGKIRSMVFNKNAFNILKIERQEGTMHFYINDHYIDEISNVSFFGKKVGFFVNGKSEIAVDYTRSQIWLD